MCNYFVAICVSAPRLSTVFLDGTSKNAASAIFNAKLAGTLNDPSPKQANYEMGPIAYCRDVASAATAADESINRRVTA
jgi:hypothetical protein